MTLIGSQDTGIGSVDTAAGGDEGGGGAGTITEITSDDGSVIITDPTGPIVDLSVAGSNPSGIIIGKFTGAVITGESATFGYLADPGQAFLTTDGDAEPAPQLYPTGARTFSVMRVTATGGGGLVDYTVTLYKNGAPTAQQVTIPASSAAGTVVSDGAHPIAFAAGDKFDARWDIASGDGSTFALAVVLEGPAGGGSTGGGTLALIYAFGLSDDPAVDNLFGMPGGVLAFPGRTQWGTGFDAEIEFAQDRAAIDLSKPPAYERIGMAGNISGAGGAGAGLFLVAELNDPAWNGTFAQLNLPWQMESAAFSRDTSTGAGHLSTEYARRGYNPFGQSPHVWPDTGRSGNAMVHGLGLYSSQTAVVNQIELASGFGEVERVLSSLNNGANAQWLTHWINNAAAPAAGDGPAWIVEASGDIGHYNPRAVLNAYQVTADPHTGAWGWALQAFDGATINQVARFDNTGGYVLGKPLPTSVLPLPAASAISYCSFSVVINFTGTGTYAVIPPVAARLFNLNITCEIKTTSGVTVSPTISVGTNGPAYNNKNSASVSAGFLTQAAETLVGAGTTLSPAPTLDLSTGLFANVSVAATATALTGRIVASYSLLPL